MKGKAGYFSEALVDERCGIEIRHTTDLGCQDQANPSPSMKSVGVHLRQTREQKAELKLIWQTK